MNPNARHVIDTPPRSKLRAFAQECPEVREALAFAACCIKCGDEWTPVCEEIIGGLLRRMSGEEPPR